MDETLALPSEKAAEIALRTQQLIAHETGVANVVDPMGGSWFVESLTDSIEEQVEQYFKIIDELGGVIPAIEQGYLQHEIANAASDYQNKVDNNQRIVVSVNDFVNEEEEIDIPITVEPGSIIISDADLLDASFELSQGEVSIPVVFYGTRPDLFKDDAEIIVEGKYLSGMFNADQLQVKCASRYEGDLRDESSYRIDEL